MCWKKSVAETSENKTTVSSNAERQDTIVKIRRKRNEKANSGGIQSWPWF